MGHKTDHFRNHTKIKFNKWGIFSSKVHIQFIWQAYNTIKGGDVMAILLISAGLILFMYGLSVLSYISDSNALDNLSNEN